MAKQPTHKDQQETAAAAREALLREHESAGPLPTEGGAWERTKSGDLLKVVPTPPADPAPDTN